MNEMVTDSQIDSKPSAYNVEILTLDTKFSDESLFSSRVEVDLRMKFEDEQGRYAILSNKFSSIVNSRVETADIYLEELEVEESTLDVDELYKSIEDSKILLSFTR